MKNSGSSIRVAYIIIYQIISTSIWINTTTMTIYDHTITNSIMVSESYTSSVTSCSRGNQYSVYSYVTYENT